MSDEEDVVYVKKQRTIHYGSLEDSEKARLAAIEAGGENSNDGDESPASTPINAQVHISDGNNYFLQL